MESIKIAAVDYDQLYQKNPFPRHQHQANLKGRVAT